MKASSLTNTQDQLNATNSSFNNPASLKGKLQSLEAQIKTISSELNTHKK